MHDGIATGIIDETIGRAILIGSGAEVWGATVDLKVRFKKPLSLDQELRVVGRITKSNRRFFEGTGEIILPDGTIAVTAIGRYLQVPLEKISAFNPEDLQWEIEKNPGDPKLITF